MPTIHNYLRSYPYKKHYWETDVYYNKNLQGYKQDFYGNVVDLVPVKVNSESVEMKRGRSATRTPPRRSRRIASMRTPARSRSSSVRARSRSSNASALSVLAGRRSGAGHVNRRAKVDVPFGKDKVTSVYKENASGHIKSNRKRRKRTSKRRHSGIKKSLSGPRCTVDFWQQYYVAGTIQGAIAAGSVQPIGQLSSNVNEYGVAMIPLFEDFQMNREFRVGENTSATSGPSGTGTGNFGFFDPPSWQTYAAGVKTTYGVDLIKNSELFVMDRYEVKMNITNVNDTKCHFQMTEWVCNDDSEIDFFTRATALYNTQYTQAGAGTVVTAEIPGAPSTGGAGGGNLFKQPEWHFGRIPDLKKFWKIGMVKEVMILEPGETKEVILKWKNLKWDFHKFYKMNYDATVAQFFHKNLSRFLVVQTRGMIGTDASVGNVGKSAFQPTVIQFLLQKTLVGHRADMLGVARKQYGGNIGPFLGSYKNVDQNEFITISAGPVSSTYEQLQNVS